MSVSDDELIRLYSQGDALAFDVLFDRHHASVYSFARMMLGGADGADAILQETFLAIARTARRYEPRGRFRPWLMRIARNLCLNRLRSERSRRQVQASPDDGFEPASREPDAPEQLERDERMAALRVAISQLPERQREALVLYAFEQMPYRVIAETLEAPLNTVRTLIHRARANLARQLEEDARDL